MKRKWLTIVLLLHFLTLSGWAETRSRRWLRRVTLAGACAASFWDVQSTRAALSSGAAEGNRLFADSRGQVRLGRFVGIKIGACGAMVVAQETKLFGQRRVPDSAWITANTTMAGVFGAVSLRNQRVASGQ